jgi:hypothetical protein
LWCWMDMQGDESNPALPRPDPLKECGKDRSVLRELWRLQTFVCVRGVSAIVHIYTSVLQALAGRGRTGRLEGGFQGYRDGTMQDLGYELPRIPIPRTSVHKEMAGVRPWTPARCGLTSVSTGFFGSRRLCTCLGRGSRNPSSPHSCTAPSSLGRPTWC